MKPINLKSYSAHHELSQLLPWYVNKTLQGIELKAVEEHLTVCLVCKRELNQLQKVAQAVALSGSMDTAEQAAFSRLKKRLHNDHSLAMQTNPGQLQTRQEAETPTNVRAFKAVKKPISVYSRTSRAVLAVAAAMLLSLSVIMPRYFDDTALVSGNFRTLSSDKHPEAMKKNEIRVVFAENVNPEQKDKILGRIHGQIVGEKPTAQGVYTIRLNNDIAASQLTEVIDSLRKDSNVIFAEPAYAMLSSTQVE